MKIVDWDSRKCPTYGGVVLTVVRLIIQLKNLKKGAPVYEVIGQYVFAYLIPFKILASSFFASLLFVLLILCN